MKSKIATGDQPRVCRLAVAAVLALGLSMAAMRAEANGFNSIAFVKPSDLVGLQQFGSAIAADGAIMAVGTRPTSTRPGSVYVFANNNGVWSQQAELTAPDGFLTDRFGSSIAVQGGLLVVGAGSAVDPSGTTTGAAYIFANINGAWTLQQKIFPAGATGPTGFGGGPFTGIAISGNTIAVGAGGGQGAVYVFVNSGGTWVQQARITPNDPLAAAFGASVGLSGDTLIVGAPETNTASVIDPGAGFIFSRQNGVWTQQARLDPSDPLVFGNYGDDVSVDGNTAVIGGPIANEVDAYISVNGSWSQQAHLIVPDASPDGSTDTNFGTSLKVIGDVLMVGAYDDVNAEGVQTGKAYVYTRGGSTWTEHPDLEMAPGDNNFPGPAESFQRFANFATMTRLGSQMLFVIASHTFSDPAIDSTNLLTTLHVGAVYTATLN